MNTLKLNFDEEDVKDPFAVEEDADKDLAEDEDEEEEEEKEAEVAEEPLV
ncbi:MAG: hypothetical protein Q7S32_03560 [bacterium]|nr:hypothetical protein [bacterium]